MGVLQLLLLSVLLLLLWTELLAVLLLLPATGTMDEAFCPSLHLVQQ